MHLSLFCRNLEPNTNRLTSLGKKSQYKQFWKSKKYEKEIQDIKASIASHIQDFTVRLPSFYAFYVCLNCSVSSSIITFPSKYWWIKCPQKVWRVISLSTCCRTLQLIGWIHLSKEWNHKVWIGIPPWAACNSVLVEQTHKSVQEIVPQGNNSVFFFQKKKNTDWHLSSPGCQQDW
jgi:hypothetical protein